MRITELLTESQLEQLDEGPMLNKFGAAVGNVAGGVAKGVGAVAGGIAGIGSAFKKGFDRSKGIVGQGGDYVAPDDVPAPPKAGTPAPAPAPVKAGAAAPAAAAPQPQGRIDPTMDEPATTPASTTTPPSAAEINAQGPKGTAPAKAQTGDAGKALAKTTAVVDKQQAASQEKANQTVYAQVKANVDKLDKKGKQRILQLLQKSVAAPQPAAPAAPGGAPKAGAGAFGQMVNQLAGQKPNTMANAPVSKTNVAQPGNPNAAAAPAAPAAAPATAVPATAPAAPAATKARGGKVAGQVSQTPGAIAKRGKRQAASAASSTGNKVMGNMVNTLQQQNASKINLGNTLSETLIQRVELHKQKMFETDLVKGNFSIFKK
jgi:hypothetical protein